MSARVRRQCEFGAHQPVRVEERASRPLEDKRLLESEQTDDGMSAQDARATPYGKIKAALRRVKCRE